MTRLGATLTATGRAFIAISMVAFGVQQFDYSGYLQGLEFVPRWIPAHFFWANFTGVALIAAAVSIAIGKMARRAAILLGVGFFLSAVFYHGPKLLDVLRDISERTCAFETLTLCGGAWVLAGILPKEDDEGFVWNVAADGLIWPGLFLIAVSMAIFGVDHVIVDRYVATLIPSWIPWHLFWVYFTALGFIVAGVSIVSRKYLRLSGVMLGLMFFLWVVLVHAPRIARSPHNGNEWNSGFVCLAMSGCAFILAAPFNPNRNRASQDHSIVHDSAIPATQVRVPSELVSEPPR
jgi:uncharacterized membrane protein YphA (DoxX/SURF4 family)